MKNNPQFINYSNQVSCHACKGTGKTRHVDTCINAIGEKFTVTTFTTCSVCYGTGKWTEQRFLLVAENPAGQKLAFEVDNPGK